MKRKFLPLLLLSVLAITEPGCNKYPEGPAITLRSKEERLANTWGIDKYLLNGEDKTSDYKATHQEYKLVVVKSGTYAYSYFDGSATQGETGTWKLDKNGTEWITLSTVSGATPNTYTILRLKEKSFWCSTVDITGATHEFHYEPQ